VALPPGRLPAIKKARAVLTARASKPQERIAYLMMRCFT
jgi:hypothetical protein